MTRFLLLLAILSVSFISCDGRKSKRESLKQSIAEYNKRQSAIEIATYYPKEYTEVVTDTLISNHLKIHIKNYSVEDQSILISSTEKGNLKNSNFHRVFESEVTVVSSTKVIFYTHISAKEFEPHSSDVFWNDATLQHVWVNQELSSKKYVLLNISFINPKDNSYKWYQMSIDMDGNKELKLIEDNA